MTEIEKEETKNTFKIANIIKQSNISLGDTPVYAIADLLSNAGYRKQEDTVKEFAEKINRKAEIECDSDFNISIYNLESLTETIAEQFGKED